MSPSLSFLLVSLGLFSAGGAAAALAGRSPRRAAWLGAGSALAGCAAGLVAAVISLAGGGSSLTAGWSIPLGSLSLGTDPLSGLFLLPLFLLGGLAALFGGGYLAHHRHGDHGLHWFWFNLLLGSIALVLTARDGLLFLLAWETMSLASFFLVTFEDEKESVRFAGWVYLTATHLSAFFLMVLFLLLGQESGSLAFAALKVPAGGVGATALFLLALAGFGTKAGLFPLHLWLPEAHPAAPSHVSAVLSGVMINTGLYGLLRILTFLGNPPPLWGAALLGIGSVTAVMGALYALAQRDLKRILAYSSVENMGIAAMGMGAGLLLSSLGRQEMALVAWSASLLHVLNHSAMKGLLFLGAGGVLSRAGTVAMESLGGLLRRMPWTGACFGVGSAAIASLPPLNGFAGEFLLALALLMAGSSLQGGAAVGMWGALAALALTGGLAAAVFVRAFGVAFLGVPRSQAASDAREGSILLRLPLLLLAAGCVLMGLLSPLLLSGAVAPVLPSLPGGAAGDRTRDMMATVSGPLVGVALASASLWVLLGALALLRRALPGKGATATAPTWDCGYALPTPRMQYTASSFAQPLTTLFSGMMGTIRRVAVPRGLFPRHASFLSETPDGPTRFLVAPAFSALQRLAGWMRPLQHGHTHLYVLVMVLTLVALLLWRMG